MYLLPGLLLLLVMTIEVKPNITEEVDEFFFIGLTPETDADEFASTIGRARGLNKEKVMDIKRTKILIVKGKRAKAMALKAAHLPQVKYVSRNEKIHIAQSSCVSHSQEQWNLDRIDQPGGLPYSQPEPWFNGATYMYGLENNNGEGVNVYVLDTGIDISHAQFQGRATWGYTAENITGTTDGNGHGTYVAGIVGAQAVGVSKSVNLIAVKILNDDGTGYATDFVDGLNWVREQHVNGTSKSVINMSVISPLHPPTEDVISEMFDEGISFAVAAGNDNHNDCYASPANSPEVVTVGATDINDVTASFTNYGPCVDIHAPGVDILSVYPDNGFAWGSGTSNSAPHVAGVMARYISMFTTPPPAQQVKDWVLAQATTGVITPYNTNHATSPDKLLYVPCGDPLSN